MYKGDEEERRNRKVRIRKNLKVYWNPNVSIITINVNYMYSNYKLKLLNWICMLLIRNI